MNRPEYREYEAGDYLTLEEYDAQRAQGAIVVRSLRQLDALVAERLFGRTVDYRRDADDFWQESEAGFEPVPRHTTWAGLEAVIQNRESAGYWVSMEGACGLGMTPDIPDAAFHKMGETQEAGYATGQTIPIAVCLAALASAGVRVQLEMGVNNEG